jgi:putative phosphonate transport system ATP-binding protein
MNNDVLLSVRHVGKKFANGRHSHWACRDVSFDMYPGEVLAVVGESGSGKSTLLRLLAARTACDEGSVHYSVRDAQGLTSNMINLADLSQAQLRWLARTDWGFVEQHAKDGLRMNVSGGANIGERMMALGSRHYGMLRNQALDWMTRVELDVSRIDDLPTTYSGGMQQRLQIARNLVTQPRLVCMDEPTTGLDVSVQARLLDLLRELVSQLNLAAIIVTHDLAVARLLAHRMLVMKDGQVVEQGLTDRVLDDPQHPYTQLLVSSVLTT